MTTTTLERERARFNADDAPVIAKALGLTHRAAAKLSTRFAYFQDDERFLVVAGRQEGSHVERALALGMAHRGSRRLVLALPAGHTNATEQRTPWLREDVRPELHVHEALAVAPLAPRTTSETLAALDGPRKGATPAAELAKASHPLHLGKHVSVVSRLVEWATTESGLDSAHRQGFRAWQHAGQRVLTIEKHGTGVRITAGIQYSEASQAKHGLPTPLVVAVGAELRPDTLKHIQNRVRQGVAERHNPNSPVGKSDEHWLQAVIRADPRLVGVEQPALREVPAWRPRDKPGKSADSPLGDWGRGYVDLLGLDGHGNIRIVETKLANNPDDLLVPQGLDYFVWAQVYGDAIRARLGAQAGSELQIHYVLGGQPTRHPSNAHSPVPATTRALAQALDPSITWHFHTVDNWDSGGRPTSFMASAGIVPAGGDAGQVAVP